jgi:hypothetical protein
MLELQGWKDPNTFFTDPRSWEPPPPQPDPAQMLAQLEMEKIRTEMATKAEDLRIKREQVMLEQDFKRDQLDADIILKSKELEMKYNESIDVAKIKAQIDSSRAASPTAPEKPKRVRKIPIRDKDGEIIAVEEVEILNKKVPVRNETGDIVAVDEV